MNTNEQTIHQMGLGISSLVKQATGRESVSNIDMDWVSVEQLARYIYGSGSGDVVSFNTNIPDAIDSLIAYITAVQDLHGYDNPWPGGGGNNLLDTSASSVGSINDSGVINPNSSNYRYTALIPVEMGVTYTFSGVASGTAENRRFHAYDSNGDWVSQLSYISVASGSWSISAEIPSGVAYVRGTYRYDFDTDVQIEKGNEVTAYTPYANLCPITGWTGCTVTDANMLDSSDPDYEANTYAFTFPDEAGTVYGGVLDVLSGVLTVTHEKVKVSDLSWTKYGDPIAVYYAKVSDKINNADNVLMSDTFKASENTAQNTTQAQNLLSDNMCIASKGTTNPYIYCRADSVNDATAFTNSFGDAYFVYELAEPVTYQLTAQEVTALIGQNNIFAVTGNVSVQYKVKEDLV